MSNESKGVELTDSGDGTFSIVTNGVYLGYIKADSKVDAAIKLLHVEDDLETIDVLKKYYGR